MDDPMRMLLVSLSSLSLALCSNGGMQACALTGSPDEKSKTHVEELLTRKS